MSTGNLKSKIRSLRLRTIPLSLAGVVMGIFLAAADGTFNPPAVIFLILTAACLQVLCNLANELGDNLNGTDTADRQGMVYSLQNGDLTIDEMKRMISIWTAASAVCGALMIRFAFGSFTSWMSLAFYVLGLCAIWAAKHYTMGSNPYGYRGLGDISVFIFFGLATAAGGYILCTGGLAITSDVLVAAAAIGCFSVGVLNVNNIRDVKTDAATRVTVAMKLGDNGSRIYQTVLICLGWILMAVLFVMRQVSWQYWFFVLSLPMFIAHLRGIWTRHDRELDPMLPLLVMGSFILAVLAGLGVLLCTCGRCPA